MTWPMPNEQLLLPILPCLPEPGWPFAPLERGAYSMIACDPPWTWSAWSSRGLKKSAQRHYSCMSLDDIQALPVGDLAAPDCALVLWGTQPMLPQQLQTMQIWGFEYKSHGVWCKTTARGKLSFGTGYRLRNSHEIFIIGVRGNPKNTRAERSVIVAPVREHSRKPDAFYQMCERWLPDVRRAELFAREVRPNWEAWGAESTKFNQGEDDECSVGQGQSEPA